jgi:hypothetical protein
MENVALIAYKHYLLEPISYILLIRLTECYQSSAADRLTDRASYSRGKLQLFSRGVHLESAQLIHEALINSVALSRNKEDK